MAILTRNERVKRQIDLSGPDGNAFVLLGMARRFGAQIGLETQKIEKIVSDMKSSDYENLISVFDQNFGDYVDLVR